MNERLRFFLEENGLSVRQFEALIGSSDGKIAKFLSTNSTLKSDTLCKIMELFPQLSIEWLLTGKGEMLRSKDENIPVGESVISIADHCDSVNTKQGIPLIPIEVVAGWNGIDVQGVTLAECRRYSVPEFEVAGAEYLIRVSGSSMYPKYSNGDLLACRKIHEITFFQWGKIYVIDSNQGAMVKRLFPSETNQDMLICQSDNPKYPPFELPKSDVRSLSIVIGVIRLE
ncbi:MAG: hypothetical protein NC038_05630 [Paludibacter sp.]|nr:hypothetical protein [Bacteroidales bacterium]MCM1069853.1 hypothetical protein [Prevotella sp.]MCM1353954.1 hypothetical protein [Bacteroides sp.]MCM1443404.1 hypothetical protein [Muribaculum sp.]MCM1482107.1 hypothetical protein [Paludibacter sp.]